MTTTNTEELDGISYVSYPGQEGLNCGDVITFLQQFDADQKIGWYLIAEDVTPFVGLYADHDTYWAEDGASTPAWPMIVTSFIPHDEVK